MPRISKNAIGFLLLLMVSCSTNSQNDSQRNTLTAAALNALGRYYTDSDHSLALSGSAAHVGFSFEGTECKVYVALEKTDQHNYLQYELDGVYKENIRIEGKSDEPVVIKAPKNGYHTVWLYKTTEAHTGPVCLKKITANNIKSLPITRAPLIEFIGNSITCGAAADASVVPCGTGQYHDHHNAYFAYGPRVARALQANFIVSSVSGIGVYRNWNSDGPTMPQVYTKANFVENSGHDWNFKNDKPGVVSIALGTNDFSQGDGIKKRALFDSAIFVNTYVAFVQQVKSIYPRAQIALLSSPIEGGRNNIMLQNCLTAIKQKVDALYPKSKQVALFFFKPMQVHGCSGHPSVQDHAILANELIPFFKKLLS